VADVELQPLRFRRHVVRDRRPAHLTFFEAPVGRRHGGQVVRKHVADQRARDALLVAAVGKPHAFDARTIVRRQVTFEMRLQFGRTQWCFARQPEIDLCGGDRHQPRNAVSSSRLSSVSL